MNMNPFLLLLILFLGWFSLFGTAGAQQRILFFGDSITAGYGVEDGQAFPELIQQKVDSMGWNFRVVNAGLSGETTAGGLRRVDWILRQPFDLFVLELGANDGLRGIDPASTRKNLQGIIEKVEAGRPDARIILAGMQVPPNLGPEYTAQFRQIYPDLAREYELDLIPFLLEQVGGEEDLNQSDGIHPNARGHRVIAETVWEYLLPLLENMRT